MKLFALLSMSLVFVSASFVSVSFASVPAERNNLAAAVSKESNSKEANSFTAAQDETVTLTSMKALRSRAGLAEVPVNQDPALNSLLDQYLQAMDALPAEGPSDSDEPKGLVYCGCYLYEKSGDGFNFISPTQFAASRRALGSYGAWSLGDSNLDSMPEFTAEPLLLDSRLSAISGRSYKFADGSSSFIILGRLAETPPKISIKNGASMDTSLSVTLAFTSPVNMVYFSISIRSGGSWLQKYRGWRPGGFTTYDGFAGIRMNYFADEVESRNRVRLSWGARYRIAAGSLSGEFKTATPKPPRKSWLFKKSFSKSQQKIFLAAIRQMNPRYRAMIKQIAPYTVIAGHKEGGISTATPYDYSIGIRNRPFEVSFARSHMQWREFRKEVIAHELAHILDYAGLDDQAYSAFLKKFKKSSKWRRCKPGSGGGGSSVWPCIIDTELIADQMAYSALNKRSGAGGYADPRLISSGSMISLLGKHFHLTSPYEGSLLSDSDWRDIETPEEAARDLIDAES